MSFIHRVVLAWSCGFVFLILLSLKLDDKIQVQWFIVFIPLFALDAIQLLLRLFRAIVHCKNRTREDDTKIKENIFQIAEWLCLLLFQVLLCLTLDETVPGMQLYFAFIPLWLVLIGLLIDLAQFQYQIVRQQML